MDHNNLEEIPAGWYRTYTGKLINVINPTADMICIEDIAHALAQMPRWAGHMKKPFTVAQHSLEVMERVEDGLKLDALLHDASEAYLMDIPSPLKKFLPDYKAIEDNMMKVIAKKFKFEYPLHDDVKKADKDQLDYEWSIMKGEAFRYQGVIPTSGKTLECKFIYWFTHYCRI